MIWNCIVNWSIEHYVQSTQRIFFAIFIFFQLITIFIATLYAIAIFIFFTLLMAILNFNLFVAIFIIIATFMAAAI